MGEIEFSCDKLKKDRRCSRPAYMEVYYTGGKCTEGCPCNRHWSYLCRRCFYVDLLKNKFRKVKHWYAAAAPCDDSLSLVEEE